MVTYWLKSVVLTKRDDDLNIFFTHQMRGTLRFVGPGASSFQRFELRKKKGRNDNNPRQGMRFYCDLLQPELPTKLMSTEAF